MKTLTLPDKLILKYDTDAKIILVALLFYLSARLGYFLSFENTTSLPAWPPSGIAFALTILLGRNTWPGITIGSLIANLLAYWHHPSIMPHSVIMISSGIAIGQTLEAIAGNYLLKLWVKDSFPFNSAKHAFRFLFVTMLMTFLGAGIGSYVLYMNDVVQEQFLLRSAFSWWIGNAVGILLFTPFLLSIVQKPVLTLTLEKFIEIGIVLLFGFSIHFFLQIEYISETFERALPFLTLPLLLWIAFRFNISFATTGVMISAIVAIYATIHNHGPFVLNDPYNSMLLLQIFIGVSSVSAIVLAATVKERKQAQLQLIEFNATLESKVQERTKELNEEITTRKTAEEKIQRTNQELSKRNTELDNFVYSVSHDLRAPIASVLGLINLAKKDPDLSMKDKYLDMINHSALQQDHFIREILDQSRNSRLDVKREEIYFEPLVEETFDQLKFATTAGQSIEKIIDIRQEKPFFSDRWRLKVILNNIISNAIRYRNGRDPVIKIAVEFAGQQAHLVVEDNGKGIEKEHLPNLCKMFYRATDDGAGSGLGLYIVKETVDKLQGNIIIESEAGVGTRVSISIPELLTASS